MAKDDAMDGEDEVSSSTTSIMWNKRENTIHWKHEKQVNQKIIHE